ncbi:hypothetical protein KIW84_053564 [Lathyrus oleraceus]|uniref:Uncharacterized protein n=1 Tax=Pisum sativum TaxID=3888 RepID=A0A9D4WT35_PEA|nr:hypothetical protein KIW84_053564 [Pisum sativum]
MRRALSHAEFVTRETMASFYFSNFPDNLRNARSQLFGFALFVKVRDVEMLSKALNNFYFGDYRLVTNMTRYDRFENFDWINLGKGGEKMVRHEDIKYSRENRRREAEFGISRKKELERVKEEAVIKEEEKEKLRVVTDEGLVSKVLKERDEDMFLSTRGNSKNVEVVEDGKGEIVPIDISYEVVPEDFEWACNGMMARIQNDVGF